MCPIDSSRLTRRKADRIQRPSEAPERAFEMIASKVKLISGMSAVEIMKGLRNIPEQRSFISDLIRAFLFRQVGVKESIGRILAAKDPDALTRAYMLYGSSLDKPKTLIVYTRGGEHELRGNIRIDFSSGGDVSRQRSNLELPKDPLARLALEQDAVFYHHGDKVSWIQREDIIYPHIESRHALHPHDNIARLVMPLSEGFGVVDVRGENLTFGFGLDDPHRTALISALDISNYFSMRFIADTDPITGLFNRRAFMNFFEHYANAFLGDPAHMQKAALVLLEIDRFETIRKRYGPEAEGKVLLMCRSALKDVFRTNDALSSLTKPRERFTLLLADTDEDEAVIAAKRCRDYLQSRRAALEGRQLGVSAIFGIADLSRAFEALGRSIKTPLGHYTQEINRISQDPCKSMAEKLIAITSALAEFALYHSKVFRRNAISTPWIKGDELTARLRK